MINIDNYIKEALKAQNRVELNAYKNLKAEIQKNQTAKGAKPLTEESQMAIFAKYAKTLEDSIKQFSEANRSDLVSEYTSELEVVQKLLPAPVTESDIWSALFELGIEKKWVNMEEAVCSSERKQALYIPKREMGTTIKHIKSKFPAADGKMISEIVKKYLV
jgi:uncharacterized protein YqeY